MSKRFASIDFLRGLAILLMVFVHTFMRWIDRDTVQSNINDYRLIILWLMLGLIFIGAWAGFFLMVSAAGNMISMYKGVEKSGKVGDMVLKQVLGGTLLLFCGVLVESVLGYHAALGELVLGKNDWWTHIFYRGYHMETIHAIAWCIILNGIIQGILSINGGWKKINRNIIIYSILAIVVIVGTVFVWQGVRTLLPGYPFADRVVDIFGVSKNLDIQYGVLGVDPFFELVWKFFLIPLAGKHEPIFPFLAISFIGSIIGLFLMRKQQEMEENKPVSTKLLKYGMIIGLVLFVIGLIGTGLFVIQRPSAIDNIILPHHFDVIHMYVEGLESYGSDFVFGFIPFSFIWLPWFLMVTGAQFGAICLILRTVEFRGKSKPFGRKTRYFRRYGFVAFSIYAYQFVDILAVYLLTLIPWFPSLTWSSYFGSVPENMFDVYQIWPLLILIFVIYEILIRFWEKAHFTLGYEWFIAKIAGVVIPSQRKLKKKEGFFRTIRLDVNGGIYNPEWIEIVPGESVHTSLADSKLSGKLCWIGIFIPPISFVSLGIASNSMKTEGKNKYNKRGLIVSLIGLGIAVSIFIASFFLPISALGLF
ncbi:MAG: hypothetical protein JW776_16195 [Candidatus Lokiarchaeota archaeon]|nr:hypothetical protein [Candidatus Lokiarchaeota archaeon]